MLVVIHIHLCIADVENAVGRWRLLERKRLSALSSQPPVYRDTEPTDTYRGDSPQPRSEPGIDWPTLSMLDVTRYWSSSGEEGVAYASSSCIRTQDFNTGLSSQPFDYSGNGAHDLDLYTPHHQQTRYSALSAVRETQIQSQILSNPGVHANNNQHQSRAASSSRELDVQDHDTHLPITDMDVDLDEDDGAYDDQTAEGMDRHGVDVPGISGQTTVEHDARCPAVTPSLSAADYSNTARDGCPDPRTDNNSTLGDTISEAPTIAPQKSSARKRRPAESLRLNGDLTLTSKYIIMQFSFLVELTG